MTKISSSGLISTTGQSILNASSAASARTTLGLGSALKISQSSEISNTSEYTIGEPTTPALVTYRLPFIPSISGNIIRIGIPTTGATACHVTKVSIVMQKSGYQGIEIPTLVTFGTANGYDWSAGTYGTKWSDYVQYSVNTGITYLISIEFSAVAYYYAFGATSYIWKWDNANYALSDNPGTSGLAQPGHGMQLFMDVCTMDEVA